MTYDITGPDALASSWSAAALMPAVYGAVEAGSRAGRRLVQWRASRRAAKATRKPRQPIPFVERPIPHRERWPLVTVLGSRGAGRGDLAH